MLTECFQKYHIQLKNYSVNLILKKLEYKVTLKHIATLATAINETKKLVTSSIEATHLLRWNLFPIQRAQFIPHQPKCDSYVDWPCHRCEKFPHHWINCVPLNCHFLFDQPGTMLLFYYKNTYTGCPTE